MMDLWSALLRGNGQISAESVLMHLLLTFVLSQLVAWTYAWTHRGVSYSRSQVQSLVLLSLVVTVVMMAIGNNLARAFGLFGALALIRFRTPIKDIRDTVFLFVAVAIGIAVGSNNAMVAVVGTVVIVAIVLYLDVTRSGSRIAHNALLRFQMRDDRASDGPLLDVLRRYCRGFSLAHMREHGDGQSVELAYRLRLLDPAWSQGLVADLRDLDTVSEVSLHLQEEDVEV